MFYYADLMTEVAIHVPALNLNVVSMKSVMTFVNSSIFIYLFICLLLFFIYCYFFLSRVPNCQGGLLR